MADEGGSSSVLTGPAHLLPPTMGFECGECLDVQDDQDDLPVTFYCRFPDGQRLVFGCRKPSFGVLTQKEERVEDFDVSAVDPNFFDEGYTLAGSTGFCVWAGARLVSEAFACHSDFPNLPSIQGLRILELGAGVGLLGATLAMAGAQVLLTDLNTLVDFAIQPNLERNSQASDKDQTVPEWLSNNQEQPAYSVGKGWASARALDWSKPVESQLTGEQLENIDIIVASDCAWLASMLDMLLETIASIFASGGAKSFFMAFQRRESNIGSATFTTESHLQQVIRQRGWSLHPRAWRPVTLVDQTETVVCLVEIRPDSSKRDAT